MDTMKDALERRMKSGLVVKITVVPPGAKGAAAQAEEDKTSDLAPHPMEAKEEEAEMGQKMTPELMKEEKSEGEMMDMHHPEGMDMEMPSHTRTLNAKIAAKMAMDKKKGMNS